MIENLKRKTGVDKLYLNQNHITNNRSKTNIKCGMIYCPKSSFGNQMGKHAELAIHNE